MSSENATTEVEFRDEPDDAWYSVTVALESDGDVLKIKFSDFPEEEHDRVFNAKEFKSLREVEGFKERFRPLSVQVQDSECYKVAKGDVVCASFSFDDKELKFYNARVDGVENHEHSSTQGGEEVCLCTFILEWLQGPNLGNLTTRTVENICHVQCSAQTDPKVAFFLEKARQRFQSTCIPGSISKGYVPTCDGGTCKKDISSSNIKQKQTFIQRMNQETRRAQRSPSKICPSEGRIDSNPERPEQDMDFGGVDKKYMILLENLDKELSPLTIVEFLNSQTSILPQVYVFPSWPSESYTKGALVLDCEKKFKKLCDFLESPNHIVMSSRGRPWVITDKMSGQNILRASSEFLMLKSQVILHNRSIGTSNELKVVCLGTEEYRIAKLQKDLYMELFNHQKQLQKRLDADMGKIWLQSHPL